jgi:hypothetical protein
MGFNSAFKGLNTDKGEGKVVPVHSIKANRGTRGTAPLSRWR